MDVRATEQVENGGTAQLRRTAAAALGVLAFAALPAPSLARSAPQARFKATVDGVQTVTWKRDDFTPSQDKANCGDHLLLNGTEQVAFHTQRPLALSVGTRTYGGHAVPRFRFPSRDEGFTALATIDRAQTDNSVDTCTGQPIPQRDAALFGPQPSDCGRRQVAWRLFFAPAYVRRDAVYVDDDYRKAQAADPFAHCPARAAEWPSLAAEDPSNINRLFSAPLSTRRLFDRRVKKFDVRGRGSCQRSPDPNGESYTVQVSWHVVLRRVR